MDNPDKEYLVKKVKTVEEAKRLIEQGFEYVLTMDEYMIFRKRK